MAASKLSSLRASMQGAFSPSLTMAQISTSRIPILAGILLFTALCGLWFSWSSGSPSAHCVTLRQPHGGPDADSPELNDVIGWKSVKAEVLTLPVARLPGLEGSSTEASAQLGQVRVLGSLVTTPYGPGNASVIKVAGTRWLKHSLPLTDPAELGSRACEFGAPHGGTIYPDFAATANNRPADRMNDRTTLEPSIRAFVHFVQPLPDNQMPVELPYAHPQDRDLICNSLLTVRPEMLPRGGCPGKPWSNYTEPFPGGPWCAPWDAPVFIAEMKCGFVETAHMIVSCSAS